MLPTFIIIGAMKCGTTSLYNYLRAHPEISMSKEKEPNFFATEYDKGLEWYASQFTKGAKAYGEASTNYSKYPTFPGVAQRMYSILPNAKLIYILRDPVGRIVSHYLHNYFEGREKSDLYNALSDFDNNHYIACSKYYMQLQQYLKWYPKENILVISAEKLGTHRHHIIKTVFRFLGVDDSFYSSEYSQIYHRSSQKGKRNQLGDHLSQTKIADKVKPLLPSLFVQAFRRATVSQIERPKLDKVLEARLKHYLTEDVNSLREYTGDSFEEWRL